MLEHPDTALDILREIQDEARRVEGRASYKELATLALCIERLCLRLMYMTAELSGIDLAKPLQKIEDIDDGIQSNWGGAGSPRFRPHEDAR